MINEEVSRAKLDLRERRLREIAHRIWEDEGRPDGQDQRHWKMAKDILRNERIAGEDSADDEDEEQADEERRH